MILVTGATGNVGGAALRALCEAGLPARAMVRSPERGDDLRGLDCEVAVATFEDTASLRRAVEGVTGILLLTSTGPDQADWTTNVATAAADAGHPHVVTVVCRGYADGGTRVARGQAAAVAAVDAAGLPRTVLAASSFLQGLLSGAGRLVASGVLGVPGGDARLAFVDARDVAAVAVAVLADPTGHEGADHELTGPAALGLAEVAAALSAGGRTVRYEPATPDVALAEDLARGTDPWLAEAAAEQWAARRDVPAEVPTDVVRRVTGRDPRSLADFLADHPALLRAV